MTEEEKKISKKESAKRWRENNKEYYLKNKVLKGRVFLTDGERKEKEKERSKIWRENNKEYISEYQKNKGLFNNELEYGWDIDHIIPLSSANTQEELVALNHYTNLQPLCSKVNRHIKKDNLNYEVA